MESSEALCTGIFTEERCLRLATAIRALAHQVLGTLLAKCRERAVQHRSEAFALATFRKCVDPIARWEPHCFEREVGEWTRKYADARSDFCYAFATYVKQIHRTAQPLRPRKLVVMMPPTCTFVKFFLTALTKQPTVLTGQFFEPTTSSLESAHIIMCSCREALHACLPDYVTEEQSLQQNEPAPPPPAALGVVAARSAIRDAPHWTDASALQQPPLYRRELEIAPQRHVDASSMASSGGGESNRQKGRPVEDEIDPSDSVSNVENKSGETPLEPAPAPPASGQSCAPLSELTLSLVATRPHASTLRDEIPLSIATS